MPSPPPPRRTVARRLPWLATALAATVVLLFGGAVYATYQATLTQAKDLARVTAGLVEGSVTRTLQATETTLLTLAAETHHAVSQSPSPPPAWDETGVIRALMDQTLLFAPYLRHLVVADTEGRVVIDSADTATGQFLDLQSLGLTRAGEGGWKRTDGTPLHRGMVLGSTIAGRYLPLADAPPDRSARTLIPAMLATPQGYLIIAALNPSAMRRVLHRGVLGPSSAVWLTRLDGSPLIQTASAEPSILRDRTLWLMPSVQRGLEAAVLPLQTADHSQTVGSAAFRLSSRYPVAVIVAVARRDSLKTWLTANGTILFWGVISLLGLLMGTTMLVRETLRRDHLEQRLRLVDLTEAVFAHSTEAMLITDNARTIIAANPSFLATTGQTISAVIGHPVSRFLSPAPKGHPLPGHPLPGQTTPDPNQTGPTAIPPRSNSKSGDSKSGDSKSGDSKSDSSKRGHPNEGYPGESAPIPDPPYRYIWDLRTASGETRCVNICEAPLFDDAIIITFNDITEQMTTQRSLTDALQRAELANRAKSDFLASMSHDLRTPLNAILGFSEILRDQLLGTEVASPSRDYATDIHISAVQLRDIVADLLDLAKIEAGTFDLDPTPLDVNDEVAACCRLLSTRAKDHGLTLSLAAPVANPMLIVDGQVFRQMLFNLLSNAIKFTPSGGRIRVSCAHDDQGCLHVAVEDTGIGIPDTEQARIFQTHERAIKTQTRHIEGSGLGLALVKSLMDLHGGRVTLDSTPHKGSTFTLVFPADRCSPRPTHHQGDAV